MPQKAVRRWERAEWFTARDESMQFTLYNPNNGAPLQVDAADEFEFKISVSEGSAALITLTKGGGITIVQTGVTGPPATPAILKVELTRAQNVFTGQHFASLVWIDVSDGSKHKPVTRGPLLFALSPT